MSRRITITVSEALYERLREYAGKAGSTMSHAAARLLADALASDDEDIPPQDSTWGRYSTDTDKELHND